MTKLTRRSALGLTGGALGLAACQTQNTGLAETGTGPERDTRPAYAGTVSFDHGVASGDPLPNAMVFWTRVTRTDAERDAIPVRLEIFKDAAATQAVRIERLAARSSRDDTVKVDVTRLTPATVYYYRFVVNTEAGDVTSPMGRTRTLSAVGTDPVRLALVSCSNYPFGHFNVYEAIAGEQNLDAVIHLGDYLYEYGPDGYGGEAGQALGREHQPAKEIITLADYRMRHAQYKADPKLQAAHAAAPWICTWDDHESANDAYRTGAENHDPASEGNWSARKQVAVQAYLEWMPVRDPAIGEVRSALWRSFAFGDLATLHCLETRLTGRSDEISWAKEVVGLAPEAIPEAVEATLTRVHAPARTMLGAQQEDWLAGELKASTGAGKTWQVLANQILMARMRPPNFSQTLTSEQIAAQTHPLIKALIGFSAIGAPLNLDAWDGFPAARDRLYTAAESAGARLVTLTGDTHTAWANTLRDGAGAQRGVEFGCTSVTSPGFGDIMTGVDDLGKQFAEVNGEIDWHDPFGSGYTRLTLTQERARADFIKVSTVTASAFETETAASFVTSVEGPSLTPLKRI